MGKGGQQHVKQSEPITWEEVQKHDKTDDKWLVINNNVYEITRWARKHPGGSRVISHFAGQDATEAFTAFHNDQNFVQKFLKPLYIGPLKEHHDKMQMLDEKDEAIKHDMKKLRETVTKMGCFKPSIFFYVTNIAHLVLLEFLAFAVMYYFGTGWIPWTLSILCFTTMQAQAGWSQHDYGHLSVFNQSWLNHVVHHFTMTWMKGASCDWWNHLHYQHHAKPNVLSKDPDVRLEKLFVLGETMPKKVAKQKTGIPYDQQHKYFFFIGPPLLFPLYFQYRIIAHPIERKKYADLFFMSLFYLRFLIMYNFLLGPVGTLVYYLVVRCLESHWFVWVTQSNHIPMDIAEDSQLPWFRMQLKATCNVEKSVFNDWFTGHLNFQIEHHLFPTMPRHNLYKTASLVKSLCKKYDVPYVEKSLSTAFADIVRSLKSSGALWRHYYEAYHLA